MDSYRFKSQCRIETCKYYTEKTANKCMALDTVFSSTDKGTTDAELRLLKLPEHSKREVFVVRKEALENVQAVMALYRAVRVCREEKDSDVFPEENSVTQKVVSHPLFNDSDIGMEEWMLPYLFDPKFMSKFGNPKIHTLFDVSDKEMEQAYPSPGEKK